MSSVDPPIYPSSTMVRLLYTRAPVRVLLVEHEGRELPYLRDLLMGFADRVLVAEAADLAAGSRALDDADLIVMARDAWNERDTELCRILLGRDAMLPILAVSGPCEARHLAAALRAGADGFLAVPFDLEGLVAWAFALVRRASSGARRAKVGVFSVDLVRRRIVVDGNRVQLTLREYDVLSTLIERVGEVVTRGEIAERMTPEAAVGDSNVIDVHVSRIRDKLGQHAADIETVRGLGYRLRKS